MSESNDTSRRIMTTEELDAVKVDEIRERIAPIIMHEPLFETASALLLLAAHTALHDGADEESFLAHARASYRVAVNKHSICQAS